jgi:hypothetical protein
MALDPIKISVLHKRRRSFGGWPGSVGGHRLGDPVLFPVFPGDVLAQAAARGLLHAAVRTGPHDFQVMDLAPLSNRVYGVFLWNSNGFVEFCVEIKLSGI